MKLSTTYIQERLFSRLSDDFNRISKKRRIYTLNKLIKKLEETDNRDNKKSKKKKRKIKSFSDREIVPRDIAQKARKEGVIQQDKNGDWRIISFKQNPPEFWDAHYDSKDDAEKALGAYHAQKHYSSYDNVSDEDLEDEVYKRALKKHRRRNFFKWSVLGGISGAIHGLIKKSSGLGWGPLVGTGIGAIGGALYNRHRKNKGDEMNSKSFQNILRKEYEKAYKNRPHLTNQYKEDNQDDDNTY